MSLNGDLVNIDASHYSGNAFTSRVIPSTVNPNVMPEPASNIQGAASYIPCQNQNGGKRTKINRRKINKISRMYKMKSKRHVKRMKSRLRSKYSNRRTRYATRRRGMRRQRSQKGGYAQYQNNLPMTQNYSLGGILAPSMSALASPPPYQVLSNCTDCIDNYSRFPPPGHGFPSRGH
jgi:hypothetical protein